MSKYTTEVRFICEQKSGLSESKGCDDVDTIIKNSWNKIFTTNTLFFDETYRSILCSKILKHYYTREIGAETVGLWKLWMNTKLEEIMPYYNQMYESALLKFNPLYDVDVTRKHNKKNEQNSELRGTTNGTSSKQENETTNATSTANTKGNTVSRDLYSDTPQGALTGVESETYLTNARKILGSSDETQNVNSNSTTNGTTATSYNENTDNRNNLNGIEDYIETVTGKQGNLSYSKLLTEFRETFLNIDMLVIDEFSMLFLNLW